MNFQKRRKRRRRKPKWKSQPVERKSTNLSFSKLLCQKAKRHGEIEKSHRSRDISEEERFGGNDRLREYKFGNFRMKMMEDVLDGRFRFNRQFRDECMDIWKGTRMERKASFRVKDPKFTAVHHSGDGCNSALVFGGNNRNISFANLHRGISFVGDRVNAQWRLSIKKELDEFRPISKLEHFSELGFMGSLLGEAHPSQVFRLNEESFAVEKLFSTQGSIWTFDWNRKNLMSVGLNGGFGLYDLKKDRLQVIKSGLLFNRSDILSQCFDTNGNHLINGKRNGSIEVIDLRQATSPVVDIRLSSPITHVSLSMNGWKLFASGLGSVHSFDLRKDVQKEENALMTYFRNHTYHMDLRFSFNPSQTIITTCDEQNLYLYQANNGTLVKKLQVEDPVYQCIWLNESEFMGTNSSQFVSYSCSSPEVFTGEIRFPEATL